jgi:hypothetical protein
MFLRTEAVFLLQMSCKPDATNLYQLESPCYSMSRVKVNRISGVTDPLTGMPAKQIELVEVRDSRRPDMFPASDEARVVQGMVSQLQSMGLMPQIREFGYSKVVMTLTESEYDMLGMRLDVNEIYELDIRNGSLTLKKVTEGT